MQLQKRELLVVAGCAGAVLITAVGQPMASAGDRDTKKPEASHASRVSDKPPPAPPERSPQQDPPYVESGGAAQDDENTSSEDSNGGWLEIADNSARLEFTVSGATITAVGDAKSDDKADPAVIAGKKWGWDSITFVIGGEGSDVEEGSKYKLWVRNQLVFDKQWTIDAGGADMSISAHGVAFDIYSTPHAWDITDQSSGTATSSDSTTLKIEGTGTESETDTVSIEGSAGSTGPVPTAAAKAAATAAKTDGESGTLGGEHTSSSSSSSGPSALGSGVFNDVIEGHTKGETPDEVTYHISTKQSIRLKAQHALSGWGSQEDVVTDMINFEMVNRLTGVYEIYTSKEPKDPPTPTDENWVTLTPGGEGGPGGAGGTEMIHTPGRTARLAEGRDSLGLASEGPYEPGTVCVLLDAPAPSDMHFAVSCSPSGALDFGPSGTAVVPAGLDRVHFRYLAQSAGSVDVSFDELDDQGVATGASITATVFTSSISSVDTPEIGIGIGHEAGSGSQLDVLSGDTVTVRVSRGVFDDGETEGTTVSISAVDPTTVFGTIPSEVTIPAGDRFVEFDVDIVSTSGEAQIVAELGTQSVSADVRVAAQGWERSTPRLFLHEGSRMNVYAQFEHFLRADGSSSISVGDGSVASVDETTDYLYAGDFRTGFGLQGLAAGSTTVTLSMTGLPDQTVDIDVVANEIDIAENAITISSLDPDLSGKIVFGVTGQAKFMTVTVPSGAQSYVDVTGVGTDEIVVEIQEGAPLGGSVSLALVYDMNDNDAVTLSVLDLYHHGDERHVNNYFIDKP